jgi:hypothetical protein
MNLGPQSDHAIGRSAIAKAMRRILSLILLAYIVAYIDRVNVSSASLQMNDDLKFSATIHECARPRSRLQMRGSSRPNPSLPGNQLRDSIIFDAGSRKFATCCRRLVGES